MTEENLLTQWARLLLGSLCDAGVTRVVISPGSRSTPFAAAALAVPAFECLSVVDERDAAFFALGNAKARGGPALVICTSGTAGAHYLPAVLEAEASYTPLLILTADRPTELSHCHAPQTLDQIKLFGDHARGFFELGAPDPSAGALRALRRTAAQAVARSRGPVPGAVHLNARARKPLEPAASGSAEAEALEARTDALLERPLVRVEPPVLGLSGAAGDSLQELIEGRERGLIVCGPGPVGQGELRPRVEALARLSGYPLLVEAASQWRYFEAPSEDRDPVVRVGALDALGRSPALRERLAPELILQLGAPPVATGWSRFVEAHPDCPRLVVHPHGWMDPWSTAMGLLQVDLGEALTSLCSALERLESPGRSTWRETWHRAEEIAWRAADEVLREEAGTWSEGKVARAVVEALPPRGGLALGNSLPIREVDGYSPPRPTPLAVWSQRGVSGIDGVLAGAAGFAVALGEPTALLVGDVSFLHGLSGLACLAQAQAPVAVVVVNNDGGRIFEQLPLAEQAEASRLSLDPWITPHGLDLRYGAKLHRLPFRRVGTEEGLRSALAEAFSHPRPAVIEARVPDGGARTQNRRLWKRVDEALAREWQAP